MLNVERMWSGGWLVVTWTTYLVGGKSLDDPDADRTNGGTCTGRAP
jgi:hypothetical protein